MLKALSDKLLKITNRQAAILIACIGVVAYFSGLTSPFQDGVINQVFGYSFLHLIFGAAVLPYHLLQLVLCTGSAVLFYLMLRASFKQLIALPLALIFLVHPLNSEATYALGSFQGALCVFFGLLAMWLLYQSDSRRNLVFVAASLMLSMASSVMGLVFAALSLLYLFWFNRKQLPLLAGILALPVILSVVLRRHALLASTLNVAPIDRLGLVSRLYTAPSIMWFYLTRFVYPWKLATGYYWTDQNFSVSHVLLPFVGDLLAIGLFVYLGYLVKSRLKPAQFHTFLFFAAWTILALLPRLQILPLDMTASETWFYPVMAGLLGMIGMAFVALRPRLRPILFYGVMALIVGILGFRSLTRGFEWQHPVSLAKTDITVSPDDYKAYDVAADTYTSSQQFEQAATDAQKSINIFPTSDNYNELGLAMTGIGDYSAAVTAYDSAISYDNSKSVDENLGLLALLTGTPSIKIQLLQIALQAYPHDTTLWTYLAVVEQQTGNHTDAVTDIANAANYGQVPAGVTQGIQGNLPFSMQLSELNRTLQVQ